MKVRALRRAFARAGFTLLRCKGSHETWELAGPLGKVPMTIVANHPAERPSRKVDCEIRRKLVAVGLVPAEVMGG